MNSGDIYVRGWGAVTTLGWNATDAARNLIEAQAPPAKPGRSSHLINRDFNVFEVSHPGNPLEKAMAMLEGAIDEAFERAGLSPDEIAESSVLIGTTGGLFIRNEHEFIEAVRKNPDGETPPISCRNRGAGEVADFITKKYGIRGMALTFSIACVSSSHALVVAADLLQSRKIRRAIVIGFEPLLNMTLHGFSSLLLFDYERCRPFCATRAGMQIGEAASAVILDSGQNLSSRYTFSGGYLYNDIKSMTSAGIDGVTVSEVVRHTLDSARLSADDIIAIKAHGTGTKDNDLSEGRGLVRLFGEKLPPVVSLKGAIGHTLGAAGTAETALWLSCLDEGIIPRSFGFSKMDPEIGFTPSQKNIDARDGAYLFTFFGFGGTCTSYLIIRNSTENSSARAGSS
ncbi:MAG TPA: beta-ketoacyl synthase N-terminal-like domain-containing protein [Smithella sp.]|jgi:3-oxoacyl-(acyl-carrier-protein) synthase|nr:beta-ketoacyl synthase N-terminal-like domain-containing protein [Smithella sp.]HOG09183.1 beta-ketoacyl synthase N-terminal-like domain-containing protein [Smithella sp.]HOS13277.1 beta-ketoacyl synthase N-terminal-like domain-containing protein [Smithella sp.]HOX98125.1 beta-ketoacyl synthase N-terminal-like domain-containing protein [Smithella sp.]HPC08746.1 beta-ketoacyl synthase N-terminal-like domain-containing protein [Smithella sp.]